MQTRSIMGVLFILSGIVFFGAGGAVMVHALDRQAADQVATQRAEISCREQLVKLGRVLPQANDELELEITDPNNPNGLTDPRSTLATATATLAMCTGREIVSACLGTTCGGQPEGGPIRMVIRLGMKK